MSPSSCRLLLPTGVAAAQGRSVRGRPLESCSGGGRGARELRPNGQNKLRPGKSAMCNVLPTAVFSVIVFVLVVLGAVGFSIFYRAILQYPSRVSLLLVGAKLSSTMVQFFGYHMFLRIFVQVQCYRGGGGYVWYFSNASPGRYAKHRLGEVDNRLPALELRCRCVFAVAARIVVCCLLLVVGCFCRWCWRSVPCRRHIFS